MSKKINKKIKIDYGLNGGNIYINCSSQANPDYAITKTKAIFQAIDTLFMSIAQENLEYEWEINNNTDND